MKLTMLVTALAAVLVLGVGRATAAQADSSTATGRRRLHSSTPASHTKSMDSWLRWLLFRSRLAEKVDYRFFFFNILRWLSNSYISLSFQLIFFYTKGERQECFPHLPGSSGRTQQSQTTAKTFSSNRQHAR